MFEVEGHTSATGDAGQIVTHNRAANVCTARDVRNVLHGRRAVSDIAVRQIVANDRLTGCERRRRAGVGSR